MSPAAGREVTCASVTPVPAGALTVRVNWSTAVPPLPSSAVTCTVTVPASAAPGVPVNVLVAGSKPSHGGNALPPSRTAR